jgi:hypothetical protein
MPGSKLYAAGRKNFFVVRKEAKDFYAGAYG